jgi:hypothetical protein
MLVADRKPVVRPLPADPTRRATRRLGRRTA